jgi:hypothetical protein
MMGINLLETVRQKLPFTEDDASELLIDAVHKINENWPSGALLAAKGTPLYTEYQKAIDNFNPKFFIFCKQRHNFFFCKEQTAFRHPNFNNFWACFVNCLWFHT